MTAFSLALAVVAFAVLAGHRLRLRRRLAGRGRRRFALEHPCIGAAAGAVVAGIPGAVVGAACGVVAAPAARVRDRRRASTHIADSIPDLARSLASGLRAGRNIHLALVAAAEDAAEPLRDILTTALARLDAGASLEQALEPLGRTGPRARLLADALLIGRAAGANLPGVLDNLAASIAERARIERDRRAATAQARMSAVIVAAMPAAFYAMVGAGAREQVSVLVGDPIGWTLLAAGVALEAAGLLWMRALLNGGDR